MWSTSVVSVVPTLSLLTRLQHDTRVRVPYWFSFGSFYYFSFFFLRRLELVPLLPTALSRTKKRKTDWRRGRAAPDRGRHKVYCNENALLFSGLFTAFFLSSFLRKLLTTGLSAEIKALKHVEVLRGGASEPFQKAAREWNGQIGRKNSTKGAFF